jgi:hypothetical protein
MTLSGAPAEGGSALRWVDLSDLLRWVDLSDLLLVPGYLDVEDAGICFSQTESANEAAVLHVISTLSYVS